MFLEIFCPQDPQKLVIFSGPDPVRFAGEQSLPLEGPMNSSGWFFTNPSEEYARQIGSFPPKKGPKYKIFETTT